MIQFLEVSNRQLILECSCLPAALIPLGFNSESLNIALVQSLVQNYVN